VEPSGECESKGVAMEGERQPGRQGEEKAVGDGVGEKEVEGAAPERQQKPARGAPYRHKPAIDEREEEQRGAGEVEEPSGGELVAAKQLRDEAHWPAQPA